MLILELLRYVAGGPGSTNADRVAQELQQSTDHEFLWAIEAGLGPLLYGVIRDRNERLLGQRHSVLLSSDLTARIKHGLRVDCALHVIDACASVGEPVTLLKGISISEQFYPQGHLRPMSDIDVLVARESYARVEQELLQRGFTRGPDQADPDSHHGIPLLDPGRRVWVELHWTLYPARSGLQQGSSFAPERIASQSLESRFQGITVRRFSRELQLVYVASSWVWDLTLCKIHPSFVIALFDAVWLLQAMRENLDWPAVMEGLDNPMACASLHVMLNLIDRHGLSHPPILGQLGAKQKLVGRLELEVMLAMLDRTLLAGRTWNFVLPPPVPGRYNLSRQFRKRVLRRQ